MEYGPGNPEYDIVTDMQRILQYESAQAMREQREEALESIYEAAKEDPDTSEMLFALQLMSDQLLEMCPGVPKEAVASTILASATLLSSAEMRSRVPQLSSESLLLVMSSLLERQ